MDSGAGGKMMQLQGESSFITESAHFHGFLNLGILIDNLADSGRTVVSLAAALLSIGIVILLFALFKKLMDRRDNLVMSIFFSTERGPISAIAALIVLNVMIPFDQYSSIELRRYLTIGMIIAATWFFLRLVAVVRAIVYERFPIDKEDNLHERKVRTQFQYMQITLSAFIMAIGLAFVLFQFERLRVLGSGLLVSTGVAAIVLAFAAHQTLGNLLAGFQIAFTQPFRIDDVVIVEGEWGRIEEITFTYVIVRIWDQRRLVLPLSYFLNNPFQNWTRTSADIWGTVNLYVDYSVPVERVREELKRILESSKLWDGKVAGVQITDTSEKTVTLRALVSARNASDAWDLRCLVRERLIEFLQREYPDSLPRLRVQGNG
jgi:small-conductance mechanosensitive channel